MKMNLIQGLLINKDNYTGGPKVLAYFSFIIWRQK